MNPLALQSLNVSEFRGLGGLKLEEFARINLFVGGNNAGKTSVLEALALFARPLDIDNWVTTAWRREGRGLTVAPLETIKWMFPRGAGEPEDSGQIWIEGEGDFVGRRLLAKYYEERTVAGVLREPGGASSPSGPTSTVGGSSGGSIAWTPSLLPGAESIGREIQLEIDADFIDRVRPQVHKWGNHQNQLKVRIAGDGSMAYGVRPQEPLLPLAVIDASTYRVESRVQSLYSAALEAERPAQDFKSDFLRTLRCIDPGIQRLDLVQTGGGTARLQIKHEMTGITPLSALGDGFRRALTFAVAIPTVRGGVLLIDELETALHVSVLESVLGLLRWAVEEFDVQVFATTHSLEAVDAVVRAFARAPGSVVGYRLERAEAKPVAKRLSGEGLRELRFDMGLEFR
ncbi:MAG: hypothetical protein FJ387_10875 [Verrucomicrobia bacterium]|nr:hypothetical protein [Verrucomicrobiota bacterium]